MSKNDPHFKHELVELGKLKPHPRNYRSHPDDQLEHIVQSIKEHGIYRNVVTAKNMTILAGHGVVEACRKMGLKEIPVIRLPVDPNSKQALKILAGDNEVSRLGVIDERALMEILKEVKDYGSLLGTGYDELALSNLVFLNKVDGEVDPYAEWVGMPKFENQDKTAFRQILVSFKDQKDVDAFAETIGQELTEDTRYIWFPEVKEMDTESKRY